MREKSPSSKSDLMVEHYADLESTVQICVCMLTKDLI